MTTTKRTNMVRQLITLNETLVVHHNDFNITAMMASEDHLNTYSSIQIETIVVLSDAEIDIHTADYPPVKSSAIQTRKVNTLGEKVMTKESDRTSEQHTHSKII